MTQSYQTTTPTDDVTIYVRVCICIYINIHTYTLQQLIADGVILDDEDDEEWDDGLEMDLCVYMYVCIYIYMYVCMCIYTHKYTLQQLIADGVILDDEDDEEWDDGLEMDLPSTHKKLHLTDLPNTHKKIGLGEARNSFLDQPGVPDGKKSGMPVYDHIQTNMHQSRGARSPASAGWKMSSGGNLGMYSGKKSRVGSANEGQQKKGLPLYLQWGCNDLVRDKVLEQYRAFAA
jgi:hypothetical protein